MILNRMKITLQLKVLEVLLVLSVSVFSFGDAIAQSTDAKELKVLSWNVYLLPGGGTNREGRTAGIINSINSSGADVVVLSEMFSNRFSNMILAGTSKVFQFRTRVLGRNGGWEDGGVVILSRFPMEMTREYIFDASAFEDRLSNKGVMYTAVRKTIGDVSSRFHIFATHTQADASLEARLAGARSGNNLISEAVRREQFSELAQFIDDQNIDETELVIITGDLNVDFYDSAEYSRMLQRLDADGPDIRQLGVAPRNVIDPSSGQASPLIKYPTTYSSTDNSILEDSGGYELFLDYALYSRSHRLPALAASRVRRFSSQAIGDFSDHFAVFSTFHIENNSECRNFARLTTQAKNFPSDWMLSGNEIRLLCGSAKRVAGPARCYKNIAQGNITYDGEAVWNKAQAISFCSGNVFTQSRLKCFENRIGENRTRRASRALCNPSRVRDWPN